MYLLGSVELITSYPEAILLKSNDALTTTSLVISSLPNKVVNESHGENGSFPAESKLRFG